MKKYNLSNIMKRAWELVKKSGMTISSGLRKAWEEAKKIEKKIFKGRMEICISQLLTDLWKNMSFNLRRK